MKQIDVKKYFDDVRSMYADSSQRRTFNCLMFGDYGTGKTYGLRYARPPVLIHSFDKSGAKNLREYIEKGDVIVDARFADDDPTNPKAFRLWEEEFRKLEKADAFSEIGTYVIDSLSSFSDALMFAILHANGRAPIERVRLKHSKGSTVAIPEIRDYQIQMATIAQELAVCTSLPCDFIATAHLKRMEDEDGRLRDMVPMLTGDLKNKVPLLFDEVWITEAKKKGQDVEYTYLTRTVGLLKGRTMIGAGGIFDEREPQNIRAMLKKAKFDD